MKQSYLSRSPVVATALLLFTAPAFAQDDGGFGWGKKDVTVTTVVPPRVLVLHDSFSIEVTGQQADAAMRDQIHNALRTLVQEASKSIRYDERGNGRLRLAVTVDVFSFEKTQVQREVSAGLLVKKKETHTVATVNMNFRATFRVEDWTGRDMIPMEAGQVPFLHTKEYNVTKGETPPSEAELRQQCVDALIGHLRRRMTRTEERFSVLLGKVDDRLERGNFKADANEWDSAYAEWTAVPAFSAPKAEAYRLFNIGVATEAIGYRLFLQKEDAATAAAAVEKFRQARALYEKALDLKPQEKFFRRGWSSTFDKKEGPAPLERIDRAIKDYDLWRKHHEALMAARDAEAERALAAPALPDAGARSLTGSGSSGGATGPITNEDIVEMVEAGASVDLLTSTIDAAEKVDFDVTPNGKVRLLRAKVPEPVIKRMEARQLRQRGVRPKSRVRP